MITKPIKPMIKRPGGKTRLLKHLMPLIEARPHVCYVEVFAGGAAVLGAKAKSEVEVINDADQDLANCYRQIQHHEEEVIKWLPRINSRQLFKEWKTASGLTDIQRAARYLYLNALSFGAEGQSWGVNKQSAGAGAVTSLDNLRVKVKNFTARLDRVNVESLDWSRCIDIYDSAGTLFFCDPPYTTGGQKSYSCFTKEQADALALKMRSIQGQMILTIDDTPDNRARFKGLIVQRLTTSASIRASCKRFGEFIAATPLPKV